MKEGLYIHIPYCRRKCGYCGFTSYPLPAGNVPDELIDLLLQEMRFYEERLGRLDVDTVFIGGGTPSLLAPSQFERLMKGVRQCFDVAEDAEITSEANPDSLSEEVLAAMAESGINRLSMGAQSLDNTLLSLLGRIHDRDGFLRAYERAAAAGFDNINIDLMFGLPMQTYDQWMSTLRETAALGPSHLSLYTIQLEEGTPFYEAYRNGKLDLPAVSLDRQMYHDAAAFLRSQGMEHYEISNFAHPGAHCRHNLKYWDMTPFIGIGPSAASYMENRRYQNPADLHAWKECIGSGRLAFDTAAAEGTDDAMEIFCFTSLRTAAGLDTQKFKERFGISLEEAYQKEPPPVDQWIGQGLLRKENTRLILTEKGIDVSNEIMSAFMR